MKIDPCKTLARPLAAAALAAGVAAIALAIPTAVAMAGGGGADVTIKYATLAPDGTPWMKAMERLNKDIKKKTDGRVEFKFYAGGIRGDESEVLQRMEAGQLQGGGFTGIGLGEITGDARLLELPFVYDSYEEVDHVRKAMQADLVSTLDEKGFIFLGWVDTGWVHMYSRKPVKSLEEMRGTKTWVWEGDPLAHAAYTAAGVKPTPLALPDVRTSLQTGLIDTVYNSPLGLISLQWQTQVKYKLGIDIGNGTGAGLVTKSTWEKISAEDRKTVLELSKKHTERLSKTIRKKNGEASETLVKEGVEAVPISDADKAELRKIGQDVARELAGKLYSQENYDRVMELIAEYRAKNGGE